ncbi:MAG: hypothetical protein QHG99_04530 [Methanomicrobiales archaeon]|nr:hypothetical protein [Methanomicrobiales archaeon]
MINPADYTIIAVVSGCFGLLVGFQLTHITYVKRLTTLAKRCVDTGTIAPVLVEIEKTRIERKTDIQA